MEVFKIFLLILISTSLCENEYTTKNWSMKPTSVQGKSNVISTYYIDSTVFYAYKEGDKFYINKGSNTLEVPFEGIETIISIDKNYFICPKKGKAVYKVDNELNSVSVAIDTTKSISTSIDYDIKCTYQDVKQKVITLAHINYEKSFIIPYIYSDKYLTRSSSKIQEEGGGYACATLYKEFSKKVFITLLKNKEEHYIKISSVQYTDDGSQISGNQICSTSHNIDIFSRSQMTLYSNNYLLVLSYEPNGSSSSYKNLVFEYFGEGSLCSNLLKTFSFFPVLLENDDFTILEIKSFNDESRFFYYMIQSKKTSKKYVGVIDGLNNVVIYNSQQDAEYLSSYNKDNNDSTYIGISTDTGFSYICPFESSNCQLSCSSYLKVSSTEGNTCNSSQTHVVDSKFNFIEGCPLGYIEDGTQCTICSNYYEKGECVIRCSDNTILVGNICLTCSDIGSMVYVGNAITIDGKVYSNGSCMSESVCPTTKAEINTSLNTCTVCADNNQYFSEGKCVDKCPDNTSVGDDNVCINCKNNNKYYSNGLCVAGCPSYAEIDEENKVCIICQNKPKPEYLSIEGKCVAQCDNGQVYDEDNKCTSCEDSQYVVDNKCLTECPTNTKPDIANHKCIVCKDLNQFYFNKECYEKCPEYTEKNENYYTCTKCLDKEQYALNGQCVPKSDCPKNSLIDANGKCSPCIDPTPYLHNEECVSSCPVNGYNDKDNICVICKDLEKFYYNGGCVDECPDGTITDDTNKMCTTCPTGTPYLYNNKCIEKCPEGSIITQGNECYVCKDYNTVLYNGKCLNECPNGSYIDDFNVCHLCKDNNQFLYNECVNACPKNAIVKEDNICELCGNKYKYEFTNTCVDTMPKGSIITDELNKIVKKCSDYNEFYYNSKCLSSCPVGSSYDEDKICTICKDASKYLYGNECVESCPPGLTYDSNNICETCDPSTPYLSDNQCVTSCPTGSLPNADNTCHFCKDNTDDNTFFYNNKCLPSCPDKTVLSDTSTINECITCESLNKLYYKGQCYDTCPGYSVQSSSTCVDCEAPFLYYYKGSCIQQCPIYNHIDETNHVCTECKANNQYYYNGECYDECPERTKPNEVDMICDDACQIECLNGGECDVRENKCICPEGFIGPFCEISRVISASDESANSEIWLYSINGAVTFNATNLIGYSTSLVFRDGYQLQWVVYNKDTDEEIKEECYVNGKNEEMLKLSSDAFNGITNARIKLVIIDLGSNTQYMNFIDVSFNMFDNVFDITIEYEGESSDIVVANKESVLIVVTNPMRRLTPAYNGLTYTFSYIDMNGEVIPFSYDESKKSLNYYEGVVPLTNKIVITITDSKGQSINIYKEVNVKKDENFKNTIVDIVNNAKSSLYKKLLDIYNYIVHNLDKEITTDDLELINKLIKETNGENKLALALLSYLIQLQQGSEAMSKVVFGLIDKLNDKSNTNSENIKSFYRDLDKLLNSTINSDGSTNITDILEKGKDSIQKINNFLAQNLVPGEALKVDASTFKTFIQKPGRNQSTLSIDDDEDEDNKTYSEYDDYSIKNTHKSNSTEECSDSSLFCISKTGYKDLSNKLSSLKNTNMTDVSLNVIKMNNTKLYEAKGLTPMTTSSIVTALYANSTTNEIKNMNMDYSLSFKISNQFDIQTINANSTCVPISSITSQSISCKTYFNYKTNRTICKCNGTGEIAGLFDYTLANFYKLLQFPKISVNMINPLSAAFVACSLSLIIIFSTVLLIYDYIDDKDEMIYIELSDAEKVKKELVHIKGLKDTKTFGLAWFVTFNVFPFFEMIYIYNYKQPRYIRFIIQMISMLVSLMFSIIPYYKTEFTYKEIFINERDIEKEDWDIANLPTQIWDVICSLIYSIAASISIIIIVSIFSCLLRFKELLLETWKYRKKILINYIRQNLVTDELTKWNRVKTRIRAMNAFFGIYENIQKLKKMNKKIQKDDFSVECDSSKQLMSFVRSDSPKRIESNSQKKLFIERNGELELNVVREDNQLISEEKLKEKIKQIKKKYSKTEDFLAMGIHYGHRKNHHLLGYQSLAIQPRGNYSYFNSKENSIEIKAKCTEKVEMIKTIAASLIMMVLLCLIYLYLIVMFSDIYERYQFYIVKVWLIPSLINLTLVRLATSFVQNLIYIILVIYFYKTRYQTTLTKFLFKYIIPKYLIYTYKVQMMLNKYDKQLKKDLELKTSGKIIS